MKAARVVDEIAAAGFDLQVEHALLRQRDLDAGLGNAIARPLDGGVRVVDGLNRKPPACQEDGVAAIAAAEVNGSARPKQAALDPSCQALVVGRVEEGAGFGAVLVEGIPSLAGLRGIACHNASTRGTWLSVMTRCKP